MQKYRLKVQSVETAWKIAVNRFRLVSYLKMIYMIEIIKLIVQLQRILNLIVIRNGNIIAYIYIVFSRAFIIDKYDWKQDLWRGYGLKFINFKLKKIQPVWLTCDKFTCTQTVHKHMKFKLIFNSKSMEFAQIDGKIYKYLLFTARQ